MMSNNAGRSIRRSVVIGMLLNLEPMIVFEYGLRRLYGGVPLSEELIINAGYQISLYKKQTCCRLCLIVARQ